jgi:hypothetical protein
MLRVWPLTPSRTTAVHWHCPRTHAAGNGGFLGATGNELHTGQTLPSQMPTVFPRVRLVYFCPYSADGYAFPRSECPASLGDFTPPAGWDVREVKL